MAQQELLNGSTSTSGAGDWKIVRPTGEEGQGGAVQVFGLTSETIDVEFRRNSGDTAVSVLDSDISEDGVYSLHPLPTGEYRANKSGSSETPTVRILLD